MIEKALHDKLMEKWAKVGRGCYQKWSRMHRLEFFLKHIHHFKGKQVLELGANAGIYGYEIAQVAKSYVGVDKGDYYHKQSLITKKYIKNPDVEFILGNIKDFIKMDLRGEAPKYNALFASFALYHFSNTETDRITETILPKCDVVIISTRTSKRKAFNKYNSWKFEKPENVVKYLKDFKCEIHWPKVKKFAVIIGVRNENKRSGKGDTEGVGRTPEGRGTSSIKKRRTDEGLQKRDVKRQDANAKGNDELLPSQ